MTADAAVADPADSRWWYGVAVPVGVLPLTWVAYGLLRLVSDLGPGSPPGPVPAAPGAGPALLFASVATAALVLVGSLLAPVYALCLALDVRAVRRSGGDWTPSRAVWGAVGLLHLGTFVFSAVQLVTVPAGAAYLYRRHRRT